MEQHADVRLHVRRREDPGGVEVDFSVALAAKQVEAGDVHRERDHREGHHRGRLRRAAGHEASDDLAERQDAERELGETGDARGAELSLRRGTDPDDDWEITFRFAASPNASGISVGDISGISKKGWEYLWVRYADQEDTGSHAIVKRPVAAYVERVYDEGSFAGLGI